MTRGRGMSAQSPGARRDACRCLRAAAEGGEPPPGPREALVLPPTCCASPPTEGRVPPAAPRRIVYVCMRCVQIAEPKKERKRKKKEKKKKIKENKQPSLPASPKKCLFATDIGSSVPSDCSSSSAPHTPRGAGLEKVPLPIREDTTPGRGGRARCGSGKGGDAACLVRRTHAKDESAVRGAARPLHPCPA